MYMRKGWPPSCTVALGSGCDVATVDDGCSVDVAAVNGISIGVGAEPDRECTAFSMYVGMQIQS